MAKRSWAPYRGTIHASMRMSNPPVYKPIKPIEYTSQYKEYKPQPEYKPPNPFYAPVFIKKTRRRALIRKENDTKPKTETGNIKKKDKDRNKAENNKVENWNKQQQQQQQQRQQQQQQQQQQKKKRVPEVEKSPNVEPRGMAEKSGTGTRARLQETVPERNFEMAASEVNNRRDNIQVMAPPEMVRTRAASPLSPGFSSVGAVSRMLAMFDSNLRDTTQRTTLRKAY